MCAAIHTPSTGRDAQWRVPTGFGPFSHAQPRERTVWRRPLLLPALPNPSHGVALGLGSGGDLARERAEQTDELGAAEHENRRGGGRGDGGRALVGRDEGQLAKKVAGLEALRDLGAALGALNLPRANYVEVVAFVTLDDDVLALGILDLL